MSPSRTNICTCTSFFYSSNRVALHFSSKRTLHSILCALSYLYIYYSHFCTHTRTRASCNISRVRHIIAPIYIYIEKNVIFFKLFYNLLAVATTGLWKSFIFQYMTGYLNFVKLFFFLFFCHFSKQRNDNDYNDVMCVKGFVDRKFVY